MPEPIIDPVSNRARQTIVGLVGGLGPESTIDYYRRILDAWRLRFPESSPSIVIDSLDAQYAARLAGSDREALTEYLVESVQRLERAGVHFAAMTANTAHLVFDEIAARSSIPLLSIVETCAVEAEQRGAKRLALLGTRFTMEAAFYPEVFARRGLEIVVPSEQDRAWVHDRYMNQLLKGDFRDDTRAEFVGLIGRLRRDNAIDAVILGGTELPLLLQSATVADVPVFDTTGIHVTAIVHRLTLTA